MFGWPKSCLKSHIACGSAASLTCNTRPESEKRESGPVVPASVRRFVPHCLLWVKNRNDRVFGRKLDDRVDLGAAIGVQSFGVPDRTP